MFGVIGCRSSRCSTSRTGQLVEVSRGGDGSLVQKECSSSAETVQDSTLRAVQLRTKVW